jgi:hypothetical protein
MYDNLAPYKVCATTGLGDLQIDILKADAVVGCEYSRMGLGQQQG